MKSWKIFSESVLRVFNNFGAAVKVSLVPYVVMGVALVFLWNALGTFEPDGGNARMQMMMATGEFPWGIFAITLVVLAIGGLWIAVGWHRYVLLDEEPGWFPAFKGERMFFYFLRGFLIGLIITGLVVAVLVVLLVLGAIIGAGGGINSGGAYIVLVVLWVIALIPIWLISSRLTTAMAGAALGGNAGGIGDAWRATQGQWGMFAMLGIIIAVISIVIELIGGFTLGLIPGVNIVWALAFNWLSVMVGFSVLTTLYGHYIEGRSLG